MSDIDVGRFTELLPKICSPDTTLSPDGWTPENPHYGHCAVVSVLAQDIFGGSLLRGSLEGTAYASMGSHYLNLLPDGSKIDFTASQFRGGYPALDLQERTRAYVLSNPKTAQRYKELAFRYAAAHSPNALFSDPLYKECFLAATDSHCQKMRFGCIAQQDGVTVASNANDTNELLAYLCESDCIRNKIQSRTESMIGACDHAEERTLDALLENGIPASQTDLYIAGFKTGWVPYIKTAAEHTCLRCANQMERRHVKGIYVPVIDRWEFVDPKDAVRQAAAYALGEKKA